VAQLSALLPAAADTPTKLHARRTLVLASIAHALHDGLTDTIYVLLPVWRAEFGLSYAAVALLRGVYTGAMAIFQIPAGRLAERFGGRMVLAAGTALAALGYALAGMTGGALGLYVALALSGLGSSTQHPLASAAVSRSFKGNSRGPLSIYNFSGDLGKAAIPAVAALLVAAFAWRASVGVLSLAGFAVAALLAILLPRTFTTEPEQDIASGAHHREGHGFWLLLAIGVLDSGTRMGFLTFLPFLLTDKGATQPTIGLALALVFIGGAAGKYVCGWLGGRLGMLATTLLTEGATAALILAVVFLPLWPLVGMLPLLGLMLNGTSSVLYGTVPDLVPAQRTERAFALFYTGTIGSGALAPVLFGVLGDATSAIVATLATALTALATFPLAIALAPRLETSPIDASERDRSRK
jgi:MFS transporter, FSR family, fosmidomycin resistance protein